MLHCVLQILPQGVCNRAILCLESESIEIGHISVEVRYLGGSNKGLDAIERKLLPHRSPLLPGVGWLKSAPKYTETLIYFLYLYV